MGTDPHLEETNHVHDWKRVEGGMVIDAFPEQHPFSCACGAFTHDPETGEPCSTCNPADYAERTSRTVTLHGGPFERVIVAEPANATAWFRIDGPEHRVQKIAKYEPHDGKWTFAGFAWTLPLVVRGQEQ